MKRLIKFFGLALFLIMMLSTQATGQFTNTESSEESKIELVNIKAKEGSFINVGDVVIDGVTYHNALKPTYEVIYVISRKYKYFVTDIGFPDNADDNSEGFQIISENKILSEGRVKLGDPPVHIKLPVDEYVRLILDSGREAVWINPYFIK